MAYINEINILENITHLFISYSSVKMTLTRCLTLDKLLNPFLPQLSSLYDIDDHGFYSTELIGELN